MLASVAMLAACQGPMKIEQKPVSAALKASVSETRLAERTTRLDIRTYVKIGKTKTEVKGARCIVESDELKVSVITPATIIVPRFKQHRDLPKRGVPSALIATCSLNGKKASGSRTANAKQVSTATGAGLAGALLTTAVSAAIATSSPWQFNGTLPVVFDE